MHTVGGKDGGDGGDGGGGSAKHGKATMVQDCMTRGQENRSRGQKNWLGTSKKIKVRGSKNQGSKKHGGGQRNNLVGQVCPESKRVLKCKESFLVTGSRPKWQYAAVSWYFGSRNAKDCAMAPGRQSNSILRWKLIKHPKTLTDQLQQDEQTKLKKFRSHKSWEACFAEIQGPRVQES